MDAVCVAQQDLVEALWGLGQVEGHEDEEVQHAVDLEAEHGVVGGGDGGGLVVEDYASFSFNILLC